MQKEIQKMKKKSLQTIQKWCIIQWKMKQIKTGLASEDAPEFWLEEREKYQEEREKYQEEREKYQEDLAKHEVEKRELNVKVDEAEQRIKLLEEQLRLSQKNIQDLATIFTAVINSNASTNIKRSDFGKPMI